MNPLMFREYDIRGIADRDLPDDVVFDLGQGIGTLLFDSGGQRIALGRDCRLHSPRLHAALTAGLVASGADVVDLGVVPSPMLYFGAHTLDVHGGVQITGSHNPPSDNGLKILLHKRSQGGEQIQKLRQLVEAKAFRKGQGCVRTLALESEYLTFLQQRLAIGARRFPVVLDAGNGTGGSVALPLFQSLGFPTLGLGCEPDGRFPLHPPDPTVPENLRLLQDTVRRTGAEVGFALDGDADRLVAVDRQGRILWGDQLLILLSRAILAEQPGASFVCEVKCSRTVVDEIRRAGGHPIMWQVGHTRIKEKMEESGAALGAEMSGHLFFAHRYLGFDDAIYAAARLLELLSHQDVPLESLVDGLPKLYSTPEIRIAVPDEQKFAVVKKVADALTALPGTDVLTLDGVRVTWPDAWALVRASNTQPAVGLRFEAESELRLRSVQSEVQSLLRRAMGELGTEGSSAANAVLAKQPASRLTFFYDLGTPYCYLMAEQVVALSERLAEPVRFVPVVSGRLAAADDLSTVLGPAQRRYLQLDAQRSARRLRLPFHFPSRFPMNSIWALRLCVQVAQKQPTEQQRLVLALLKAYCVDDLDLIDQDVLRRLLLSLSLPADELLHGCSLPEVAALLQHNTEQAIAQGVWKTPCIAVGDELFIGCVPIEQVESALLALRKSASPDPKPDRQGG